MVYCFLDVAAEIVRMTLKTAATGVHVLAVVLSPVAGINRARGVARYTVAVHLSWGPGEWVQGVAMVDSRGYLVEWTMGDLQRWLVSALPGAECRVVVHIDNAATLPKKWTAARITKAAARIGGAVSGVLDSAAAKVATVAGWAESGRKAAVIEAAARMVGAAEMLQTAKDLQQGAGMNLFAGVGVVDGGGGSGGVGPAGPQGVAGVAGPAGPQGVPGADGATGAVGPQGLPGAGGAGGRWFWSGVVDQVDLTVPGVLSQMPITLHGTAAQNLAQVNGGGLWLDGAGWLQWNEDAGFDFGAGDCTIEIIFSTVRAPESVGNELIRFIAGDGVVSVGGDRGPGLMLVDKSTLTPVMPHGADIDTAGGFGVASWVGPNDRHHVALQVTGGAQIVEMFKDGAPNSSTGSVVGGFNGRRFVLSASVGPMITGYVVHALRVLRGVREYSTYYTVPVMPWADASRGLPGATGAQGPQGADGPQGPQGVPGNDAAGYVPPVPFDPYADAPVLALGGSITGLTLASGWSSFRVTMAPDTGYILRVDGPGPLDTVMRVLDAYEVLGPGSGSEIAQNDDFNDVGSQITFNRAWSGPERVFIVQIKEYGSTADMDFTIQFNAAV